MLNSDSWFSRLKYAIVWPFLSLIFKTPVHGAQTSIYCAIAPELDEVSGLYFRCVKNTNKITQMNSNSFKTALNETVLASLRRQLKITGHFYNYGNYFFD